MGTDILQMKEDVAEQKPLSPHPLSYTWLTLWISAFIPGHLTSWDSNIEVLQSTKKFMLR